MSKLMIVLLGVIAFAVVWIVVSGLLDDEPQVALQAPGPCAVQNGFKRLGNRVLWNPVSEAGRCAPTAAVLVVDNGTAHPIHIALGTNDVEIKPNEHVAITTLPGPFKLHATRNGEVIADAKITLVVDRTYVYAPDVVWTYVRRTYTYARASFSTIPGMGTPPSDERLPEALLIDAGTVDYVLEPPPDKIEMTGHEMTKIALERLEPLSRDSKQRTVGDLRIFESGDRVLIVDNKLVLGKLAVAIYIDNVGAKDVPISIDGIEVGKVRANGYLQLKVPAGKHELAATLAKTTERETIATTAGETWVWTPTRRREYTVDTVKYGGMYMGNFSLDAPPPPPELPRARALPPFQIAVDYVFAEPTQISGSQFGTQTKTVLRLGRIGDFHRQIAQEIRALKGTADDATASECDLFAARRAANKIMKNAENIAARMFCR